MHGTADLQPCAERKDQSKPRKTTNYLVEARVTGFSGGLPGELSVSDKALNGFKLGFDGSATSVTVKYIVKGGILS